MVETVSALATDAVTDAAQLFHDFNEEYDEPTVPVAETAARFTELIDADEIVVLVTRDRETDEPVGLAVMRLNPSLYSQGYEAYLAELYVVPDRRGQGYGRELITEAMRVARSLGADYAYLITSESDLLAQRLYDAAGFRTTEGEDGPQMLAYERDL